MTIPRPLAALPALPALLATILWTAAAPAATTTTWQWSPGPSEDAQGNPLAPALYYEVFVSADGGPDLLTATVSDTTWQQDPTPGVTYRVCVRAVDAYGRRSPLSSPSLPFQAPALSGVPGGRGPSLGPAYPNPFNPATTIAYTVPDGVRSPVDLRILDVHGRLVRVLETDAAPGDHTARWDGTDRAGAAAPSGVYLVRFRCGAAISVTKITLLE